MSQIAATTSRGSSMRGASQKENDYSRNLFFILILHFSAVEFLPLACYKSLRHEEKGKERINEEERMEVETAEL